MRILVLNAGSSSLKSSLYEVRDGHPGAPQPPLWEAHLEWAPSFQNARLASKSAGGATQNAPIAIDSLSTATARLLETLCQGPTPVLNNYSEVDVIGHRVVHGGGKYRASTRVSAEVKEAIAQLAIFAPQHNPAELEVIEAAEKWFPGRPQVAVFDTAFHSEMPQAAAVYPGPYAWYEQGIRRYGFHGINHQYCCERAAAILQRELKSLRLITCHLGHGCSLAAVRDGHSVETTMGFTPLEGLMMANRSGSLDPGILVHLLCEGGYTPERLNQVLNHESGLWGVSGISDDMREILKAMEAGNARARLAFTMYVHRLRFYIGAMAATLDGVDALVFTAGVGENSPQVRAAACEGLGFLGVRIDPEKNARPPAPPDIARSDSAVRVLVIAAREDWAIAQECWKSAAGEEARFRVPREPS